MPYADRIYYDGKDFDEAFARCKGTGVECVMYLPRFSYKEDIPEDKDIPIMAHNIGQVEAAKGHRVYGSYFINMFNSFFPNDLHQTTLSVELSKGKYYTAKKGDCSEPPPKCCAFRRCGVSAK